MLTGEDTSNKQKIGSHIKFFNRKYNNPIYSYYGDKKQSFMKITTTPSKLSCLSYQLPSISEEINVQTFPEILFSHEG